MELNEERREDLAFEMGSLPRYIFIEEKEPVEFSKIIAEFNCISEEGQLIDPLRKYEEINENATVPLSLEETDILKLFIATNTKFADLLNGMQPIMIQAFLMSQGEVGELLETLWKDRENIKTQLRAEVNTFRQYYAQKMQQKLIFDNSAPFVAGEIQVVSKKITVSFKKDATFWDIFNDLVVTSDLPLITTRDYYKVLKGYSYYLDHPEEDNTMYLFFRGEKLILTWNGDYTDPTFELTQRRETAGDIKTIIVGIRDAKIIKSKQDSRISFYHPKFEAFEFNKYIWSDMIMNNPSVSGNFVVNETSGIGSGRSIINMYYFPDGAPLNIEAEVKAKKLAFAIKAVSEVDKQRNGAFLTKIETRLNDWTQEETQAIVPKLSKLFGLYLNECQAIAAIYNKYLTLKISLKPPEIGSRKMRLKDIEPKLFLPGYVRNQCQFGPEIIQENEVKEAEEKGFQVMTFPMTEDEDLEQRYYVCSKHKKNIYPGIQYNKLSNKDKYKYIPCCFKDDQRTKGTLYRFYAEPEKLGEKGARAGFIETNKILLRGQKGAPPEILKRLFFLLNNPTPAVRIGTGKDPASILECISRNKNVSKLRSKLAEVEDVELLVSSQEMATIGGIDAAKKILKDKKAYLDPRIFYRLLEYYFGCRLILLGRDEFIFPNYNYTFAHFYNENPIVIAYENYGGDVELPEFPQWEFFEGVFTVSEQLYMLYSRDFVRYKVDRRGGLELIQEPMRQESPEYTPEISSQHMNSYKQVIALNIFIPDRKEPVSYLLKNPIAPLPVRIADPDELFGLDRAPIYDPLIIPYGELYYIIEGARPMREQNKSWLDDFNYFKQTSHILIEQAKYLNSKGTNISVGKFSEINPNRWMDRLRVPAPIAAKLDFSVRLFQKKYPEQFDSYKDYKVIPNRFSSIMDFTKHREEIISKVDQRVDWATLVPLLVEKPIVSKDFYIELAGRVYYCKPLPNEQIQGTGLNVCIFNTKEIFKVGAPQTDYISLLFYLYAEKKFLTFECRIVYSEY